MSTCNTTTVVSSGSLKYKRSRALLSKGSLRYKKSPFDCGNSVLSTLFKLSQPFRERRGWYGADIQSVGNEARRFERISLQILLFFSLLWDSGSPLILHQARTACSHSRHTRISKSKLVAETPRIISGTSQEWLQAS